MVILHLVAPAEFGGLEQVVGALTIGLRRRGHEIHLAVVVGTEQAERPFLRPLMDAGVAVHVLSLPPRAYVRERALVRGLCRRLCPDVVHTHGYRPDVVDAGVARRLGIPVVTTVHGFTGGGWKDRFYEWVQQAAFLRFDAVVAVSGPLAASLAGRGVPRHRIHLVPNAWAAPWTPLDRAAARDRLGVPAGRFHVGWVGRLSPEKGPDLLVEALPYVTDLPLTASVLGDYRTRPALQARAVELGVGDRIAWHGVMPEAGRLFAGFDVFVLSSRSEGTPIVLFEAMAAGTPIVATRVGGVPDVLSFREALLVPPDDPGALGAAIRTVYCDPAAAAARACAARERLGREFASPPWVERYERLYRGLQTSARAAGARGG